MNSDPMSTLGLHGIFSGHKKPQQVRLRYENLVEIQQVIDGAQGRNRTGTPVKARDFKSLASTNFATWAYSVWAFYLALL